MQSSKLILVSSLAVMVLCAAPYGCSGKQVDNAHDSGGNSGASGSNTVGGTGSGTHGDGATIHSDGTIAGTYHGDGRTFGDGHSDGGLIHSDGHSDGGLIHSDGGLPPDGSGDGGGDGAPADGWDEHADGFDSDGSPN
jgi:hypothetical protein